jgi:Dehydrogenases with different specificities (related to short-chain alcohol dehydrogenases)
VGECSRAFDLSGRNVLVTGASRGIGRAIAEAFATHGANVACVARSASVSEQLVPALRAQGLSAEAIRADISDPDVAFRLPRRAAALLGGLDVVVNNAGISDPGGDIQKAWSTVIATNLTAPYLISEAAAEIFIAQRSGRIINVGSILGQVMDRGCAHSYVASKHALNGLTKSFAVVCGPHDVQVNCLAPGYVRTDMTVADHKNPQISQSVVERTPLARWAEVGDITGAALFLASDAARFLTGQTVVVDGGWTAL